MTLSIFLVILGYLMGSICSAVIVCRVFSLPDPREEGSKNPGATNVLRLAGKPYAALVMVVDILKGTIPVLIAKSLGADSITIGFTALGAVLGHMYPIFFGFKGGKGVATAIGALLGFEFIIGVMVAATWLLVANFARYSSLASMIAISLAPLYSLMLFDNLDIFPPLFIIALLVLYKHRANINRLMDGTEPKIKFKHSVIEDVMDTSPMTVHHTVETPKTISSEPSKSTQINPTESNEPAKKVKPAKPRVKTPKESAKTTKKVTPKAAPAKAKKSTEESKG